MFETPKERSIADILAQYPSIAQSVLGVSGRLVLARQEDVLPNDAGRSDLVYLAGDEVVVVELKVVTATEEHVEQLARYDRVYRNEILPEDFPGSSLRSVLLAPFVPSDVEQECSNHGLEAIEYEINNVVAQYSNSNFPKFDQFTYQGAHSAVNNLYLINGMLEYIQRSEDVTTTELTEAYNNYAKGHSETFSNRKSRVGRYTRLARGFDLLSDNDYMLTDRGQRYLQKGDTNDLWQITDEQANEILDLLYDDPFYSDYTFTLITLLDAIFEVSKNSVPATRGELIDLFAIEVGKGEWSETSRSDIVHWVGN